MQPNILIVLSDQLRRQALSCYGDPNLVTKNIDALAADGVRFANSCSTYPVCVPFRFTFMTGHYAHTRVIPAILWRMSPSERTLADEFNDAGYESIYVGKWHLHGGLGPGMFKRPIPREHQGRWQKFLGFEFRNAFFDTCYFENDDPTPHQIEGYQTDGLFDVAMRTLRERTDKARPFVMCLSVEAPHPPYEAPKPYEEKWLGRDLQLPANFMVTTEYDADASGWSAKREPEEREAVLRDRKIYYAMLENLDDNVGRLSQFLQKSGLAENTIVVFLSDHGDFNGSHSLIEKQYAYEESAGIPLIVWGPGCGVPAGRVLNDPTCTEDLLPTVLGLAGVTPHPTEPHFGSNLAPLIRGETDRLARDGVMLEFVLEHRPGVTFWKRVWRAWRTPRYKYVVFGGDRGGMRPHQFFDLQTDPDELHNLINSPTHAELIRAHHLALRDRMLETGDHAWLAATFGVASLNEWAKAEVKAHKGEFEP